MFAQGEFLELGYVQDNDGLSWCVSGNANLEKKQYVNLEGLFNLILQLILIWSKNIKHGKLNYLSEYTTFIHRYCE
jgi:hypothetical protein